MERTVPYAHADRPCRKDDLACLSRTNGGNGQKRDKRTCDQYCGDSGQTCIEAWSDRHDSCDIDNNQWCNTRMYDGICRCSTVEGSA